MKYTENLLKQPAFLQWQAEIQSYEQDRIYCKHDLAHALDVCRIAWILYLEYRLSLDGNEMGSWEKDRFYVTGLLHDVGRVFQYRNGEHHSSAGVRMAEQILREIGYPSEWMEETLRIIGSHQGRSTLQEMPKNMEYFLRRADHLSRNCFCCAAADSCKWKEQERNQTIRC